MKIEKGRSKGTWTVLVDPNELQVASGKTLPYSTWIGTFNDKGKIHVWMPAASTPRGYKAAALEMIKEAADRTLSLRSNSRRKSPRRRTSRR